MCTAYTCVYIVQWNCEKWVFFFLLILADVILFFLCVCCTCVVMNLQKKNSIYWCIFISLIVHIHTHTSIRMHILLGIAMHYNAIFIIIFESALTEIRTFRFGLVVFWFSLVCNACACSCVCVQALYLKDSVLSHIQSVQKRTRNNKYDNMYNTLKKRTQ